MVKKIIAAPALMSYKGSGSSEAYRHVNMFEINSVALNKAQILARKSF